MSEKTREFFRDNLGFISVSLICFIYIATSFLIIGKTGKTVSEILAEGAIVFLLSTFINRMLDLQGIKIGMRDDRLLTTLKLHADTVERVGPYMDMLDRWCEEKNAAALRIERTKILAVAGLKYSDCFDEEGIARGFVRRETSDKAKRKSELRKERAYNKAIRLTLTQLSTSALTGDGSRNSDPYYFGKTISQYEKSVGKRDIFYKIGTAVLFGVYGVQLSSEINYASLIWAAFQVCLFIVSGVISMWNANDFIIGEYRAGIVKKIDNLQKFENYAKQTEKKNSEDKQNGI